jgi:hypothetical protein
MKVIGMLESKSDAEGFIKRNDPNGLKGFKVIKIPKKIA